jgi:hypothetical protein
MARRVLWPNMELIKARLSQVSQADFHVILTAMTQHGKMRNKLGMVNQQWLAAASREKGVDAWSNECREAGTHPLLFDMMLVPKYRTSEFYSEIEKLVQEENDRRGAEEQACVEEQSRRITDEDLEILHDEELTLIEVILNGTIQSPRERLDVLRLVYLSNRSALSTIIWRKWKSIAASNSEEFISKASETIHKELKRRRISLRRQIDSDINIY